MADGRLYMLQPSFAAGEISPDVADRIDLDKYQSALLQAKNFFVRPYGSVYRRPGMEHMYTLNGAKTRLQEFAVDADTSYLLAIWEGRIDVYKDEGGELTLKANIANAPFAGWELEKLRFAQSADVMFIASGRNPVQVLTRYSDTSWALTEFVPEPGYIDATTMVEGVTITPSATSGTVTLTASGSAFSSGQVGNWIRLNQSVDAQTVSLGGTGTSSSILAGPKGWKVISHGTWTGNFAIEYSKDNVNWKTLRTYTSNNDFNVTESGTFDENTYIRVTASISSGSVSIDLTRLPFTNKGTARISAYTDSTHVTAVVKEPFSNTGASDDWGFGSWSAEYGYPSCVTFFQDRLCFAATDRQPYMVWMSRTGDYYNFGTEEVEGTLTDDSAVAIAFISRRDFRIKHLVAQSDLIIMTEGNEWIISGSSTVKPTEVNPQMQTSRGTTDVIPVLVGGQMIYVQKYGRTVRDMQYNYASDSYDGMDLSILAKHLTQNKTIIDAAYRQEPDYMMWFVLSDGTAACLTYINEQKVFAWSRMETNGRIEAVETITTPYGEVVYFVVRRNNGTYLERLAEMPDESDPMAYIMLDCAVYGNFEYPSDTITVPWLANQTVDVLADGRHIQNLQADGTGTVKLDVPCEVFVMGLSYESVMELPNIETQMPDGTLQGRKKKVSSVILRLRNSLGGRVGITEAKTDVIKYDEDMAQYVTLFSGEKSVTVPNVSVGGFNDWGRVVVTSDMPYPLSIASIVRAVVPGG